jgi:hypothetical protein
MNSRDVLKEGRKKGRDWVELVTGVRGGKISQI